ncbi:DUF3761 domain-containing protein [Kineosporia babensis]|uniref:DUF3761 domain-containing protein n=1 Tax=Kineosporia babensis TaxID=499548 RepID=A0A9X1SU54_9ACTN|nr:DUF3761 domain-containing protein [Kineosporia babensis]MCD5311365.1 DUF3761 domain-containing protein [Kineosporia babensis]
MDRDDESVARYRRLNHSAPRRPPQPRQTDLAVTLPETRAFIGRMRLADKKAYAWQLLHAMEEGRALPDPATKQQSAAYKDILELLNWPTSRCGTCQGLAPVAVQDSPAVLCRRCLTLDWVKRAREKAEALAPCTHTRNRPWWLQPDRQQTRELSVVPRQTCAVCLLAGPARMSALRLRLLGAIKFAVPRAGAAVVAASLLFGLVHLLTPTAEGDFPVAASSPEHDLGVQDEAAEPYLGASSSARHPGAGGGSGQDYGPGDTPSFICADGAISYAQHAQGACSHHGGIAGSASIDVHSSSTPAPTPESTPEPTRARSGLEPQSPEGDTEREKLVRARMRSYYRSLSQGSYRDAFRNLSPGQRQSAAAVQPWSERFRGKIYRNFELHSAKPRRRPELVIVSVDEHSDATHGRTVADCRRVTIRFQISWEKGRPYLGSENRTYYRRCSESR